MPQRYLAPSALLPSGWADAVLIDVDDSGTITSVEPQHGHGHTDAVRLNGPVLPGMPNLHSHAFQRAMAGLAQRAGPEGDSFWAWRELMYRFLERLTPDDIETIATQLYVEMLEAGYTSVAEFHYLHHDADGKPYANPIETSERVRAAADASGIGLTLLPVFYAHSNFGAAGERPTRGQRRFITDTEQFERLLESIAASLRDHARQRIGVAPHSLRAVAPDELRRILSAADRLDASMPIHIHAAEQQKEIDDCLAWCGARPVQWLLDHAALNARWCVVHATHMDANETLGLAHSHAVAGLCPTTEGDLGDGVFNAAAFLGAGGHFGVGGDSHVGVDPFLELRLLEYGQRLLRERRNVQELPAQASFGGTLYRCALAGGAQALAQPIGAIAAGRRADLVVLDADSLALTELRGDAVLDSAIFGPRRAPVRDVIVGGEWQVRDGTHRLAASSAVRYRATLKHLLA